MMRMCCKENLLHDIDFVLLRASRILFLPAFASDFGCLFPEKPNGRRACLAQAPAYLGKIKDDYAALQEFQQDRIVKWYRNMFKADLVQLVGNITNSCGLS